ncbi:MAG: NADH-ubiquinone dehydrogenase, partial [Mesorhizobium sp.]
IAAWTPEEIAWVDDYLSFKGRVGRDNWLGQAAVLAAAKH